MDVGLQLIFSSYGWDDLSDVDVYKHETELALMAEELGFDCIWPTEHHFRDYSFCPDNIEFLSYIAGRTERIDLGTAAVILPWNDPLRVAEKIVMLEDKTIWPLGEGTEVAADLVAGNKVKIIYVGGGDAGVAGITSILRSDG